MLSSLGSIENENVVLQIEEHQQAFIILKDLLTATKTTLRLAKPGQQFVDVT